MYEKTKEYQKSYDVMNLAYLFKWLFIMHCSRNSSKFNRKLFGTSLFNSKNEQQNGTGCIFLYRKEQ